MTVEEEVARFKQLTTNMAEVFEAKRHDYGQTTTETFNKFGPVSMLVRMHDKMGRLDTLLTGESAKVKDESVRDTLMDLANYALITIIELDKSKQIDFS